jgi:hypothetical protein
MKTRVYWRRAHPVRLPSRDTAPHRELSDAWIRDLFQNHRLLEDRLARSLEPVLTALFRDAK